MIVKKIYHYGGIDMAKKLLTRDEVPVELTWDLSTIFPSDEAWEEEFKQIEQLISEAEKYKGKATESAKVYMKHCNLATKFLSASGNYTYIVI